MSKDPNSYDPLDFRVFVASVLAIYAIFISLYVGLYVAMST